MKTSRLLITILLISFSNHIYAQYFYRDIVSIAQTNEELKNYKKSGFRNIKIKSIDPNGEENMDFFCEKKIAKDYQKTSLYTRTGNEGKSLMESFFDKNGLLIKTYDSSDLAILRNEFVYNENKMLIKTSSFSRSNDDDFINENLEIHLYNYNDSGIPTTMYRIKNNSDTTLILFSIDDNNNVAIEKDTKNGSKYYYYYDESNRLTDIVHINEFKQKLIADYVFEYNEEGQINQMTTTEDGIDNFTVWKYDFENNIKVKERIFDKTGILIGKIVYEYK